MADLTDNELKVLIESNRVKNQVKKLVGDVMSKQDKDNILAEILKIDLRLDSIEQAISSQAQKEEPIEDETKELETIMSGFAEIKTQQQEIKNLIQNSTPKKPTYTFNIYYDNFGRLEKIIATPKIIN